MNVINIFVSYILILIDENKENLRTLLQTFPVQLRGMGIDTQKNNVFDVVMIYKHKYHKQQQQQQQQQHIRISRFSEQCNEGCWSSGMCLVCGISKECTALRVKAVQCFKMSGTAHRTSWCHPRRPEASTTHIHV